MAEIWAGGEEIAEWPHPQLPKVGDAIEITVDGNDEEADVARVRDVWNKFGAKVTRIEVTFPGPVPMA